MRKTELGIRVLSVDLRRLGGTPGISRLLILELRVRNREKAGIELDRRKQHAYLKSR
jgi:hypothetical protein